VKRTLYLLRHAKSSWDQPSLPDERRPLGKRGLRDAPRMAPIFKELGVQPQLVYCSPARRTVQTADIILPILGVKPDSMEQVEELYEGGLKNLLRVLQRAPDGVERLMLIGHNPGLTQLANFLCPRPGIENLQTCALVALTAKLDAWEDLGAGCAKQLLYEWPKKYFKKEKDEED
jgi:phosphohistidine phosphatase